jgi:predicted outer membrane repeat protein
VSSQALVVFDNVHASDCVADEGGAVRSDGDLTVLGGTFTANEAALGGAIFSSTDLTIDGTTFDGNVATDDGGAVHAAGHVEVFDATLGGNTAAMGDGGAIVATSLLTGTVDFSGNAPFDVSVAGNSDDLGLGSAHTCDSYGCQSLP